MDRRDEWKWIVVMGIDRLSLSGTFRAPWHLITPNSCWWWHSDSGKRLRGRKRREGSIFFSILGPFAEMRFSEFPVVGQPLSQRWVSGVQWWCPQFLSDESHHPANNPTTNWNLGFFLDELLWLCLGRDDVSREEDVVNQEDKQTHTKHVEWVEDGKENQIYWMESKINWRNASIIPLTNLTGSPAQCHLSHSPSRTPQSAQNKERFNKSPATRRAHCFLTPKVKSVLGSFQEFNSGVVVRCRRSASTNLAFDSKKKNQTWSPRFCQEWRPFKFGFRMQLSLLLLFKDFFCWQNSEESRKVGHNGGQFEGLVRGGTGERMQKDLCLYYTILIPINGIVMQRLLIFLGIWPIA